MHVSTLYQSKKEYKYVGQESNFLSLCVFSGHPNSHKRIMLLDINLFSVSEFTVRGNTIFRTQNIHLFSTACFCRFWPASGRFDNNILGRECRGGGLPFTVNTLEYIKFTIVVKKFSNANPSKVAWFQTLPFRNALQFSKFQHSRRHFNTFFWSYIKVSTGHWLID